ncbi:arginine exporter protein ArgO [Brucella sp. NBRC 13694]|uniref:Amino acid transporter n=1 Tax=Brucella anthropi TaxID=529 RepID=A0A011V9X7_BRUAN|nr:LysE/ArgO family amino acid transporter [Brucella anthropi]MCR5941340.1 amino acid transporter [Ochrobactrum sp. XJ1]EXL05265.1 amino acid transporter [Brucella anthropi]KAB2735951.1 amino acid transporter [Brucella anthropi]KAB2770834.1 amino acid transporter [Brucella anthropi]KAB2797533.1 amino acid transporter [Brucella anthropi]
MNTSIYVTGFTMGLTLIVAIGAQNAFVLRQGLRDEHVFAVSLACAVSDAILILIGVTSFQKIAAIMPALDPIMRYGGAAFLIWYGARSLYSAFTSSAVLATANGASVSLTKTLATCLALTWLNPHVYLDTVVLLGTISTQFPGLETSFAAGAITASFVFFFSLGFGARWLRPIFARPSSWRVLEGIIAVTMWSIALKLVTGV